MRSLDYQYFGYDIIDLKRISIKVNSEKEKFENEIRMAESVMYDVIKKRRKRKDTRSGKGNP